MIQDASPRGSKMSRTNININRLAWMDEHIAFVFVGLIVLLGIFSYAISLANS